MNFCRCAELRRSIMVDRRQFLYGLGSTLGTVAFNALLQAQEPRGPLEARAEHHPARARASIFLFMEGGPSHLDTFDPKPALRRWHLTEFQRADRLASAMASGRRYYVQSPFRFARHGRSGLWMCEHFRHLARHADDLCVFKGCQVDSV